MEFSSLNNCINAFLVQFSISNSDTSQQKWHIKFNNSLIFHQNDFEQNQQKLKNVFIFIIGCWNTSRNLGISDELVQLRKVIALILVSWYCTPKAKMFLINYSEPENKYQIDQIHFKIYTKPGESNGGLLWTSPVDSPGPWQTIPGGLKWSGDILTLFYAEYRKWSPFHF